MTRGDFTIDNLQLIRRSGLKQQSLNLGRQGQKRSFNSPKKVDPKLDS